MFIIISIFQELIRGDWNKTGMLEKFEKLMNIRRDDHSDCLELIRKIFGCFILDI